MPEYEILDVMVTGDVLRVDAADADGEPVTLRLTIGDDVLPSSLARLAATFAQLAATRGSDLERSVKL